MKNGSILSYDGSLPIAGVHALTWVLAAIFGLVVYLEVCNCPIASEDTKRMCLLSKTHQPHHSADGTTGTRAVPVAPPSTGTIAPVTHADARDAR